MSKFVYALVIIAGLLFGFSTPQLLAQTSGNNPTSGLTSGAIPTNYNYSVGIPSGLGWDSTDFPITITLNAYPGLVKTSGSVNFTPEQLFNKFSTALSAPGITYYVKSTGSDGNNCTSAGTPCVSCNHAITLGNTHATPFEIIVTPSTSNNNMYTKGQTCGYSSTSPTQDVAIVCNGGRCVECVCDAYSAPSPDGTYTNTYSFSETNVQRVMDTVHTNQYGNFVELTPVSTAAQANVIPNSWSLVAGTIYINRQDQVAVTYSNTTVTREGVTAPFYFRNQVNIYIGGVAAGDGFDVVGGDATASLNMLIASPTATKNVLVVKNSSFKYDGAYTDAGRATSVDSFNGLAAYFNVRADAASTDGFNHHNVNSAVFPGYLCVNCSAYDNGRGTNTSNNGFTGHENAIAIDVAGDFEGNRGGSVRFVNNALTLLAGSYVYNDLGDIANGGNIVPTAYSVGNSAIFWIDNGRCNMPAGTQCYNTETVSTSFIYFHNTWPVGMPNTGTGTFGTY